MNKKTRNRISMILLGITASVCITFSPINNKSKEDPNIVHYSNQPQSISQLIQKVLNPEPEYNPFNDKDIIVVNRNTNTFYMYAISTDGAAIFEKESSLMVSNGAKTITINLHSPGGEVVGAYIIKQQIAILKERGIKIRTIIEDKNACMSACPLIFLAGDERIAYANSVFMFHAPYIQFPYNESADVMREMERELQEDRESYAKILADACPNDQTIKMDLFDHTEHFYRADALMARCGGDKIITSLIPVAEQKSLEEFGI